MNIKELFKRKQLTDDVKLINQRLLNHLSDSLILMSKLKLPYFHLEGIGGIYMDETYAERNKIDLSNNDKETVFKIKRNLTQNISDELVAQFKGLIDVKVNDCVGEIKKYFESNGVSKSTKEEAPQEEDDAYSQVEKALSNTVIDDNIQSSKESETPAPDENGEIRGINPTKEEAVEAVRNGRRYFSPEQQKIMRRNYAIRNNRLKENNDNKEDY